MICQCGLNHKKARLPIYCRCGRVIGGTAHLPSQVVCRFRELKPYATSCGCGAVYRCSLLNKFCADNPLAFELYTINIVNEDGTTGQSLSKNHRSNSRAVSENFQACSECDDFETENSRNSDSAN